MKDIKINTDYIKLDQFLKLIDEASSGGDAKVKILSGEVKLNGITENRRGKKIRPGDEVSLSERIYRVTE